jgi:hypothetical protein
MSIPFSSQGPHQTQWNHIPNIGIMFPHPVSPTKNQKPNLKLDLATPMESQSFAKQNFTIHTLVNNVATSGSPFPHHTDTYNTNLLIGTLFA